MEVVLDIIIEAACEAFGFLAAKGINFLKKMFKRKHHDQ